MRIEDADVVVVGCRPAGASAAIVLAQHGRKVIALDRAKFPSDTLSTHLMTPTVVATSSAPCPMVSEVDDQRARAGGARRWRDGSSDAVALQRRTVVTTNARRTSDYHGKGASRPVPAFNEAVGLLTVASSNDDLASLETR
ncbi:monooxygenase FAD-binding [Mycolicibacterium rhodesiae JS60]|nr:monooxygenase FAD-binding [Mycolicibacterium rhodesiae JS60]